MSINAIVAELKAERARINQAIIALEGPSSNRLQKRNRTTAAGRKRISEMMKKRWAERRKKAKSKR